MSLPRTSLLLFTLCSVAACEKREAATASPRGPAETRAEAPSAGDSFAFPLSPPALSDFTATRVFPRLELKRPVFLAAAPGDAGHVYLVEQDGLIKRLSRTGDGSDATVFLDLRDRVRREHDEEGLLGLAFAPDYAQSGVFYVFYSASNPRRSQVSRIRRGADGLGDAKTEERVLAVDQPYGNHNGGTVAFGPEGYLYAGFGDGGSRGDPLGAGQDLSTLLGTIVRVQVDAKGPYRIPSDNPFVGRAGAKPEIWAYGLRNPWRFSFDRLRGDLWAGDVGQDALEEIDVIVGGGNYGWNLREGSREFVGGKGKSGAEPLIPPVTEYGRGFGESVTGGYVYRGVAVPSLRGAYVYGDYVTGTVWALRGEPAVPEPILAIPALTSFGEDEEGELYALSLEQGVLRIDAATQGAAGFPRRLSETGLFSNVETLTPVGSLEPYEPLVELWSDGAKKRRWVALPQDGKVSFSREGAWQFPVGTVTVKHFELPLDDRGEAVRRLETRVMVHERDGWSGYTYVWNEAQTDAELLTTPRYEEIRTGRGDRGSQTWFYPAGNLCLRCHTESYGRVLGLRTRQLPKDDESLFARWSREGRFEAAPDALEGLPSHPRLEDDAAPLESRVRAYLESNCALCHNPDQKHASSMNLLAAPPRDEMKLVGEPVVAPLGLPQEHRVRPGHPDSSALLVRMKRMGGDHMPPLSANVVDARAIGLLTAWIQALDSE